MIKFIHGRVYDSKNQNYVERLHRTIKTGVLWFLKYSGSSDADTGLRSI